MHDGNCYTNRSYFFDLDIKGASNSIQCVLAGTTTLNGGKWVTNNGSPVDCSTDPLRCNEVSSHNAAVSLYITTGQNIQPTDDGCHYVYSLYIGWVQIKNISVDLPSNITVLPQTYTLHAIRIGYRMPYIKSANWYYESGGTSIELCSVKNNGHYRCSFGDGKATDKNNGKWDYEVTLSVPRKGDTTNEELSPWNSNGDLEYKFFLHVGDVMRNQSITITTSSSPPNNVRGFILNATSIKVNWTTTSETNGYVIEYATGGATRNVVSTREYEISGNCSMVDDDGINIQVFNQYSNFSNSTLTTITGLYSETCYIFSVRAYTDNGYGSWTFITNETLTLPIKPSLTLSSTSLQTMTTTIIPENTSTIVTVGGSGVAVFLIALLLVMIVIIIIFIKRKKSLKIRNYHVSMAMSEIQDIVTENDESDSCQMDRQGPNLYAAIQEVPIPSVYEPTYTDVETAVLSVSNFDPQIPLSLPISLEDLNIHVTSCHSNGFESQYTSLKSEEEKPCIVGYSEENKPFNRFKDITVYDDNRIILATNPNLDMCQREYINANYVDGYSSSKKFIASQGPMKKTLVDFWRLIWQEKPVSIVMVTNLKEGTKNKCELYWPNTLMEHEEFGPFTVLLQSTQTFPDFIIRQLCVTIQDVFNDSHTLTQYHLTSWPDHGVPDHATPLMSLHKQVMATWSPSKGPILVHCSAGVGRTGTFIALDIALEQAKRERVVDIAGIVNRLRQQRMKMVQTLVRIKCISNTLL
ncbi:PREDICTED: receptor-type tyrosine-protein phosphatase kappa-like [Amphimedon queenslandica]|uniref:protein-tyrosine-phosphatase n=1 Tax=Amphimedon queenslandica TaxID=400682 RepID=A0AAN0JLH8_AMPQE|nr:PREDICTED: receptor-type tyrosine-protein phosphatase kappa-like [Amphimedon queenslandica]|eukprot:XP_019857616.1 PREDICTED: receptor-type tyrosine-protein phosphatase kappa-like [Amphimedon queenslandica]